MPNDIIVTAPLPPFLYGPLKADTAAAALARQGAQGHGRRLRESPVLSSPGPFGSVPACRHRGRSHWKE